MCDSHSDTINHADTLLNSNSNRHSNNNRYRYGHAVTYCHKDSNNNPVSESKCSNHRDSVSVGNNHFDRNRNCDCNEHFNGARRFTKSDSDKDFDANPHSTGDDAESKSEPDTNQHAYAASRFVH